MKNRIIYLISMMLMGLNSMAQQFDITIIEQTQDNLIVHYDLLDTTQDRTYSIYLYLLTDSTIAPVKEVIGDVGLEVRPGINNRIIWNARKELGSDFKGKIELEVRGKVYVPFIEFEGFPENQVLKRGKSYTFAWSGRSSSNILEFKLYRGEELKAVLPEVANTGDANIEMPTSIKPGKYRFYITDSRNKDQEVHSPVFIVKPRVPFLLKVVPLVIAGGVATYFITREEQKKPSDVEGPPAVPEN
ncbi:MAG: hypothetical protein RLO17_07740 [Cyclobacteriaceae bacterium]